MTNVRDTIALEAEIRRLKERLEYRKDEINLRDIWLKQLKARIKELEK